MSPSVTLSTVPRPSALVVDPGSLPAQRRPLLTRLESHLVSQLSQHRGGDPLLVLFDVDLALLDLSHGLAELLRRFDADGRTAYFEGLLGEQLEANEAGLRRLFEERGVPHPARRQLLNEFLRLCWSPDPEVAGNQHFLGSLELLRWLELQPAVHVAFLTERSDERREETLQALELIGSRAGLHFSHSRLFSAGDGDHQLSGEAQQQAAIAHFLDEGFRVCALVGDEGGEQGGVLRLNASELLLELKATVGRQAPRIVWTGVSDGASLERFIGSPLPFAELTAQRGAGGALELCGADSGLELEEVLAACAQGGKGLRLHLVGARAILPRMALSIERSSFPSAQLEFACLPEELDRHDLLGLRERFPDARIVALVGSWSPLQAFAPDLVAGALERVHALGFDAVSIEAAPRCADALEAAARSVGLGVDLVAASGLPGYMEAVARDPYSVSCDFRSLGSR